ncbi:MAG: histidine phosphatase family protein [Actinobacteria bacterium]|nr:histidine phosphatase family protein [Actinomycetota bacterium]
MDPHGYSGAYSRPGRILLMRHPETLANAQHRYLGQANVPLTEEGIAQCERAVRGLIAWKPDRIITSPLDRCLAIARPAAENIACPLEIDERIIEMNFGILEGLTADEAESNNLSFPWGETSRNWPVAGAESLEDFLMRCAIAGQAYSMLPGRTAIVAHGGSIRGVLAHWLLLSPERFWQLSIKNVSSCIFSADAEGNAFLEKFGIQPESLEG